MQLKKVVPLVYMFSNKQKLVFIVVTALVVGAIGMIFSSGRDRETYEDERYLGALGKRTNRDNTVWLNKAISFKKTTRKEVEPDIITEQPEPEPEPKSKKETKKSAKKKTKKDAKKKDSKNKESVVVRMAGGPVGAGTPTQNNANAVAAKDSPAGDRVPAAPYAATAGGMMEPAAGDPTNFGNPANHPDYWTGVLTDSPSLSNLEKLVSAYQSKNISDATFYSVVSHMLEDDNGLIRHYGLLSLSRTPSPRSFRELVEFKNNSQYDVTGKVDRSLKIYTLYRHANVVNAVLEDDDINIKSEAIKIGKESAQRTLAYNEPSKPEEETEPVDNIGRPTRELSSVKVAIDPTIYEEIAVKIDSISRSSQDTQIINSAQDAHSSISKLLEQYKEQN